MASLQVLIDGIVFENAHQIGIWRVFYETMRRTAKDVQYTLLLANAPKQPVPPGVKLVYSSHRNDAARFDFQKRFRRKRSTRLLCSSQYRNAIWHSTFFTRDPREEVPQVVSVFDMIAERYFHLGGDWAQQQTSAKDFAISSADQIITISRSTKSDLLRFFPGLASKVAVIHLGADHLSNESAAKKTTRESFVLFVGQRHSYKNFSVVLEAIALPDWPENLTLRVAGRAFTRQEKALHKYYGISDKITHVGHVSDQDLAKLYQSACCFIFPSMAEGFGLPVLEAQLNACVPVLSDIPVFREIAGKGALFFNPRDPCSLRNAVSRAQDAQQCQTILAEARHNATTFSWDDSAARTLELYQSLF